MIADGKDNADRQLDDILGRVKPIPAEPRLSEGELMDAVLSEIRARRVGRDRTRASGTP